MKEHIVFERGSEWRKWDLHLHTPGTAKNDGFKGDDIWEEYITSIEKSDVRVFGITDYFSMKNYLKVKSYQEKGRLKDKLILPNIELRIQPVTGIGIPINIHAIFDPTLTEEEIEREFFRDLKFEYKESTYSCTSQDLCNLGRVIAEDPLCPEESAIKKGIGSFSIAYSLLKKIFDKSFFHNRLIVGTANSSNDGMSGLLKQEAGLQPAREEICRMSDFIFSGNLNDIDYFLGKKTSIDEVINTYGNLKPCVIGSDAHSMDKVGVFPNNRITWIKADPTFEGLKQVIFEPEERIRISETCPDTKFDYNVIDYVELNKAGTWHQKIYLNQNLNTIIGGRSTGKSTLLSSIANKFDVIKEIDNKDYINSLSDYIRVFWRDGNESYQRDIEFFPQNYISKIADTKSDELLLDILLGNEEKKQRYEVYLSKRAEQFSMIQTQVALLFEKKRLCLEKVAYIKGIGDIEGIKHEIDKQQSFRNEIQAKLSDKKDILETYEEIEKKLNVLKVQQQSYKQEIDFLNQLSQKDFLNLNSSISLLSLPKDTMDLLSQKINQVINQANKSIKEEIGNQIINKSNAYKKVSHDINTTLEKEEYKQGKQIFTDNKNLNEIIKNLDALNKKLAQIKKEIESLTTLQKEYEEIGHSIIKHHLEYLDIMNDIASHMRMQHEGVKLTSEIALKNGLETALNESISLRSGAMNDFIKQIVDGYRKTTKTDIELSVKTLINSGMEDKLTLKGNASVQSLITRILSECWFELKLNVEYDGDNLKDMSPGKRSFVILKLLLDFSDKKCPILIDQPEDNLDNRAIYNELVKYIRSKKKERQIILVTHNPNIVVGADAEEIIIANQNGKNSPNRDSIKFEYVSGSIENRKAKDINGTDSPILQRCGIREHVCDILEGGEIAFKHREHKYGFHNL